MLKVDGHNLICEKCGERLYVDWAVGVIIMILPTFIIMPFLFGAYNIVTSLLVILFVLFPLSIYIGLCFVPLRSI